MSHLLDALDGVKHLDRTILPETLAQLWTQQRQLQMELASRLNFIQQDAMRQAVRLQYISPVRALLDDVMVGVTPRRLHDLLAHNSNTYDVYLSGIFREIEVVKSDTVASLRANFMFEYSNLNTACELAYEDNLVEVWQVAQIKSSARVFHTTALDDVDQHCYLTWHRCSRSVPWEQRIRRWYRRLN